MAVVDQRHQQVLEGRIFVTPTARFAEGVVEGLFEVTGETGHWLLLAERCIALGLVTYVVRYRPLIKGRRTGSGADLIA
jgi:hypothetical protein